jgi:DNA-binding NarL/FixJ family response regulator
MIRKKYRTRALPIDENGLTAEDKMILDKLKEGETLTTTAMDIYKSTSCVQYRVKQMMYKFDCQNATQLIYRLAKRGAI